ncbi:E3 ubiquitin-protein ligase SINA-like 3 isoform X2 [Coccinella septempunctata]|nr:E3 ubiquitin-protein ligase SINA-like 3 isoform X2 [Coccinella septempunctata]
MSNNIKLCVMGHSVCCECFNHLGTCPYCRSPWSRSRNYNMEQLTAVSSGSNRTKDLINNENLKCPKCRTLMDGSIVLCGGGHSYCTRCVKGIYQCIICSKLICYRRNFTLETFINNVKTLNESTDSLAKVQAFLLKSLEMFLWFLGLFSLLKYTVYLAH